MPVKVDNNQFAAEMFEAEFLNDFDNSFVNDSCLANIWDDMPMTPPQSPGGFGMSMIDLMEEVSSVEKPKQVLQHDCMWSASCSNPGCANFMHTLSTSPLSINRYLLDMPSSLIGSSGNSSSSCDVIDGCNVEDLYAPVSSSLSSSDVNGSVFAISAMENDHAYGSPAISQIELEGDNDSMFSCKSCSFLSFTV